MQKLKSQLVKWRAAKAVSVLMVEEGGREGGILPTQVYALNWITLNDLYVAAQTILQFEHFPLSL